MSDQKKQQITVFNKAEPWGTKVNFVDANNITLGYDMDGKCCERFTWYLSESPTEDWQLQKHEEVLGQKVKTSPVTMDGWWFDEHYWEKRIGNQDWDIVQVFIVRLRHNKLPDLYLHLVNEQNGYYSHGFEFSCGDEVIAKGEL